MPQEIYSNSIFNSPNKNLRGLKGLIYNATHADEIISDRELAQRKADEAGSFFHQTNLFNRFSLSL